MKDILNSGCKVILIALIAFLITGGAFGPEAGLSGFAALAVACVFLWLWSRAIALLDTEPKDAIITL